MVLGIMVISDIHSRKCLVFFSLLIENKHITRIKWEKEVGIKMLMPEIMREGLNPFVLL
jgi:hypothetical protein